MIYLQNMTPEEQRAEIRALIAYYDERGLDWIHIVAYHGAVFVGTWPPPKREYKQRRHHANSLRKSVEE